jgi:hypothetical protein
MRSNISTHGAYGNQPLNHTICWAIPALYSPSAKSSASSLGERARFAPLTVRIVASHLDFARLRDHPFGPLPFTRQVSPTLRPDLARWRVWRLGNSPCPHARLHLLARFQCGLLNLIQGSGLTGLILTDDLSDDASASASSRDFSSSRLMALPFAS